MSTITQTMNATIQARIAVYSALAVKYADVDQETRERLSFRNGGPVSVSTSEQLSGKMATEDALALKRVGDAVGPTKAGVILALEGTDVKQAKGSGDDAVKLKGGKINGATFREDLDAFLAPPDTKADNKTK